VFVPLWRFACLVLGATLPWLVGYRVRGREHIPARGGVLVVCNHVGDIDPPFVGFACHPRPAQYMALARHFTRLPLALLLFGLGAFPVRTGEPDTRALRYARDQLERAARRLPGRRRPPGPHPRRDRRARRDHGHRAGDARMAGGGTRARPRDLRAAGRGAGRGPAPRARRRGD
jgi:hypothetical protein